MKRMMIVVGAIALLAAVDARDHRPVLEQIQELRATVQGLEGAVRQLQATRDANEARIGRLELAQSAHAQVMIQSSGNPDATKALLAQAIEARNAIAAEIAKTRELNRAQPK